MTKSPAKRLNFPAEPALSPSDLLFNWLESNGISQKQFAAESGLSEALVSMLLNKKRRFSQGILSMVAAHTQTDEADWVQHLKDHEEWSRAADSVETAADSFRAGILSNRDIRRAIGRGWMSIDPLAASQVKECSIDLTLGTSKRLSLPPWITGKASANSGELALRQNRHLLVNPGETWMVWAAETLSLDTRLCGRIGSTSDLVLAGVNLNFGTQINPGWTGIPFVTLHNPTSEVYELDPGQPFMTLEIHSLSSPAELITADSEP